MRNVISSAVIKYAVKVSGSRLTPVEWIAAAPPNTRKTWLCKCDCGEYVFVAESDLKSGDTRSCGCLRRETSRKTISLNRRQEVSHA